MHAMKVGRIPKSLENGQVRLDLIGPLSWFTYYKLFKDVDLRILHQLGYHKDSGRFKAFWFSLYLFNFAYLIRYNNQPVGVVGIYQWQPGRSLFLTLAILKDGFFGKGIGSTSLKILLTAFAKTNLCRKVLIEVKNDNVKALRFWKRHGFRIVNETRLTYILDLII